MSSQVKPHHRRSGTSRFSEMHYHRSSKLTATGVICPLSIIILAHYYQRGKRPNTSRNDSYLSTSPMGERSEFDAWSTCCIVVVVRDCSDHACHGRPWLAVGALDSRFDSQILIACPWAFCRKDRRSPDFEPDRVVVRHATGVHDYLRLYRGV